jgi:hypothetical protein
MHQKNDDAFIQSTTTARKIHQAIRTKEGNPKHTVVKPAHPVLHASAPIFPRKYKNRFLMIN